MKTVNSKLNRLGDALASDAPLKILIIGLGSVGNYLLDYLCSWSETNVQLHVCGRSTEHAEKDINVLRVANCIRSGRVIPISYHFVDLNNPDEIADVLASVSPDFIVNSSRVYSGLKYGSISWNTIRAYGLWSPLSVKYIRNIMIAYERAGCNGIVINTSYADAVNSWLKCAGIACPDFGSGNLNHLIPRIKFAAAQQIGTVDGSDIEIILATSHFHDVVISKEGHTEGVDPLIQLVRGKEPIAADMKQVYRNCAISMPVDSKRNMMNASSNFEIIDRIVNAVRSGTVKVLHCPGIAGHIGGYPVRIDFRGKTATDNRISFVEDYFTLSAMQTHNRCSIALDGIEEIKDGVLSYTEELQYKVKKSFGVVIPRQIQFDEIEATASFLIERIIVPFSESSS